MHGRDESVGQIVDGEVTAGVQQRLRGGGHGRPRRRTVLGGQRALIGEPEAEERLHGPGLGDEPPGHHVQKPLLPVAAAVTGVVVTVAAPVPARRTVRGHEPPQQIDPVRLGQPQPPPEPRAELAVRPVRTGALDDAPREQPGHPEVRPGVGHPEQRLREQVGGPPGGIAQLPGPLGAVGRCPAPAPPSVRVDSRSIASIRSASLWASAAEP